MKSWIGVCALSALLTVVSYGQTGGASVQGIISDATGAVLPGASVLIKNSGTGATVEFVSDERGRYLAPVLPSGEYEIQASLPVPDRNPDAVSALLAAVADIKPTWGR
jgi:hypothetical protein